MAAENKSNTQLNQLYKKYVLDDISEEDRAILLGLILDAEEDELCDMEEILHLEAPARVLPDDKTDAIFKNITGQSLSPKALPIWRNPSYMSVAALLIAVLFAALFFWKNLQDNTLLPYKELVSISNHTKFVKSVELRDGSKILLKQGARLAILSDFDKDSVRRVKLEGEAFFEVAKNPQKAFCVIESGIFDVRVLGTAFNLVNLPQKNNLVLKHGKVKVSRGNQQMLVDPGEGVSYDLHKSAFEKSQADTVTAGLWTYAFLRFEQEPLTQIFQDLNVLYPEAHLFLHKDYQQEIFTGYLPSNDLDKSIEILNKAFNNIIISRR
ncbi:FecR family protein [Sphingobacterium sp. LRF_L2]|uniref:FecR family protein n=1 Tax=Sphingobacterium sp. LRF_L2 TaxID=3369421 RepID=UPI003F5D6780